MISPEKRQEIDEMLQKLWEIQTTQMVQRFSQINLPKLKFCLDQVTRGTDLYMYGNKTEFMF